MPDNRPASDAPAPPRESRNPTHTPWCRSSHDGPCLTREEELRLGVADTLADLRDQEARLDAASPAQEATPPREMCEKCEGKGALYDEEGVPCDACAGTGNRPPRQLSERCKNGNHWVGDLGACKDCGAFPVKPDSPIRRAAPTPEASAPREESATKLLGAWTPEHYAGEYPPYVNLTMERNPSAVVLTVRAPTVHGAPPGATTRLRLTHDAWLALVALIPEASTIYRACHELDALL